MQWWRRKQNRAERERDLERELCDHLALEAEDLGGDTYAARRAFGNTTAIKEDVRETWGWMSLDRLWQDLRYAGRSVAGHPGFFVAAVLILGLGIGINTAAFSVVRTVVLDPLPFPDPDQLVVIWKETPGEAANRSGIAPADFADLQQRVRTASEVAAYTARLLDVSGIPDPYRAQVGRISANFFKMLGVRPVLGRGFLAEDDDTRTERVAILSYRLWQQRFGGNFDVIGAPIVLSGAVHTVVGVMGEDFVFPQVDGAGPDLDLWVSFKPNKQERGSRYARVFARLLPDAPLATAQAEIEAIAHQFSIEQPDSFAGKTLAVVPLQQQVVGNVRPLLSVLWGTVICILLIACANLANMLLTRSVARQRELSMRACLGASRWRLARQLLTESLALATCGGVLGLALAWVVIRILPTLEFTQMPRLHELGVDPGVLAFSISLSMITGLLFGVYPAWRISRANPQQQLQESGRSTGSRQNNLLSSVLIVAQISCAVMLLIGAGLLIRSFLVLQKANTGVQARNVLTFELSLPRESYKSEQAPGYFDQIRERIAALPQVQGAGAISFAPLADVPFSWTYLIEERPLPQGAPVPAAEFRIVTPGYFFSMGVPLIAGRDFEERDLADAPPVGIVNESFALLNWPGENPLGKRFRRQGGFAWATVVGVVGDVRYGRIDEPAAPTMYHPLTQVNERTMTMVVRTSGDPLNLAAPVREEVRAADPAVLLLNMRPMETLFTRSLGPRRLVMMLLGTFAALALFLSTFGIYSVISYIVTQRTPEIGVRMALGARARDVLGMVLRQGALLAFAGVGLGVAGAVALSGMMRNLVYGVTPTDLVTIAAASGVLTIVTLAASYFPARRAARVDPLKALRHG